MKNITLKIGSIVFLTIFVFIKVANIHSYTHLSGDENNSIEKCHFCEFYNTDEEIVFLVPSVTPISEKPTIFFEVQNDYFSEDTNLLGTANSGKYYNKPPPFFI